MLSGGRLIIDSRVVAGGYPSGSDRVFQVWRLAQNEALAAPSFIRFPRGHNSTLRNWKGQQRADTNGTIMSLLPPLRSLSSCKLLRRSRGSSPRPFLAAQRFCGALEKKMLKTTSFGGQNRSCTTSVCVFGLTYRNINSRGTKICADVFSLTFKTLGGTHRLIFIVLLSCLLAVFDTAHLLQVNGVPLPAHTLEAFLPCAFSLANGEKTSAPLL